MLLKKHNVKIIKHVSFIGARTPVFCGSLRFFFCRRDRLRCINPILSTNPGGVIACPGPGKSNVTITQNRAEAISDKN